METSKAMTQYKMCRATVQQSCGWSLRTMDRTPANQRLWRSKRGSDQPHDSDSPHRATSLPCLEEVSAREARKYMKTRAHHWRRLPILSTAMVQDRPWWRLRMPKFKCSRSNTCRGCPRTCKGYRTTLEVHSKHFQRVIIFNCQNKIIRITLCF